MNKLLQAEYGWIDEFSCLVKKVYTNKKKTTGETYYNGYLADEQNPESEIKFFSKKDLSIYEGSVINISGKGINKNVNEYNGKQNDQVIIGASAIIKIIKKPSEAPVSQQGYKEPPFIPNNDRKANLDSLTMFYAECFKRACNLYDECIVKQEDIGIKKADFITNATNSLFATRNNNACWYDVNAKEEPKENNQNIEQTNNDNTYFDAQENNSLMQGEPPF